MQETDMTSSTHPLALRPGRRTVLRLGAAAATAALLPAARAVTGYPSRPVTIVVPSAPGGALDLIARRLGQRLGERWNTTVVVENKAGGVGTIGTNAVVRSKPDGHTLLLINAPLVQVPWLMKLPYDPLKDLSAVAKIADSYSMLAVHRNSPIKTLEEFVATVKATPGKHSFGSWGPGTSTHLWGLLLSRQAGLDMVHVPYNGAAPMVNALLGEQISCAFVDAGSSRANADSLRFLASIGTRRMADRPELPTLREKGYSGFDQIGWAGLFVPAGVPHELLVHLSESITQAMQSPELNASVAALAMVPTAMRTDEFSAVVRSDYEFWGKVIRELGVSANS
jgi:tripartite-type tricarboxylate transporter receptor subunit TctC